MSGPTARKPSPHGGRDQHGGPRKRRVRPDRRWPDRPGADIERRRLVVAELVDWAVFLGFCGLLVGAGAVLGAPAAVLWLLALGVGPALLTVYEIVGVALWGRTLGKRVAGLRVVRSDDGGAPGWRRAAVRTLGVPPSIAFNRLGRRPRWRLFALLPSRPRVFRRPVGIHQPRLHDRVAGTTVVDERSGESVGGG